MPITARAFRAYFGPKKALPPRRNSRRWFPSFPAVRETGNLLRSRSPHRGRACCRRSIAGLDCPKPRCRVDVGPSREQVGHEQHHTLDLAIPPQGACHRTAPSSGRCREDAAWLQDFVKHSSSDYGCLKSFQMSESLGQALARQRSASSRSACCFRWRGLRRRCHASRSSRLLIKGAQLISDRVQFRVREGLLFFEPR